ncbi:hypothetical protein SRHO_G00225080 [Serrasalmus rhombeus]
MHFSSDSVEGVTEANTFYQRRRSDQTELRVAISTSSGQGGVRMSHSAKAESAVAFDLWNAVLYVRFLRGPLAHRPSVITLLLSQSG